MEEEIRRQAEGDPRIYYPGLLAPVEVFRLSQQATVLINPRPSRERFTRYSFPSKLLEYMATGKPVISTCLEAIPVEYDPYLIWLDHETPECLAALLQQLHALPQERLDKIGRRGREFILNKKNYRQQGERIVEFIEHVNHDTARNIYM